MALLTDKLNESYVSHFIRSFADRIEYTVGECDGQVNRQHCQQSQMRAHSIS